MASTRTSTPPPAGPEGDEAPEDRFRGRGLGPRSAAAAWVAATGAVVLVVVSVLVARARDLEFNVGVKDYPRFPPLHANWVPDVSPRVLVPVAVAVVVLLVWPLVARTRWPMLVGLTWVLTWAWTFSLTAVESGGSGLSRVFERDQEYLYDATRTSSIDEAVRGFVARIPYAAADNWDVHVAGHPPGALLAFMGLDRLGIDQPYEVGLTVMTIGTLAVVGGLVTVRALAGEAWARRVAPFWVLAPNAIWVGVSGDALFTTVAVGGLALLALSARATGRRAALLGVGAGLLLGSCVYLSYGLVLLAILAVAVLLVARTWRPLPWALLGALVVAAWFTLEGFAWWEAYPVLRERYYDGIASERPYDYWVWADLAAWTFSIGLVAWAAFPRAARTTVAAARTLVGRAGTRLEGEQAVAVLGAAGVATVVAATLSGMSKAEVERIFLPFTFWVLVLPALLPVRWHRWLLVPQVVLAVLVQTFLLTRW